MAKTLALILTLFTTINLFGQNFEGKINYQNTYKSKVPNITDQQWSTMMGTAQEYFIKNGDYKSVTNGTVLDWQLYINKDNKLYNKTSFSEVILWNDAASNPDEVLKAELHKEATEVLGYKCDELVLTCKSGIQKYYFNKQLGVDTQLFARHKFGNWSEYITRANALPLKIIIENGQFTLQSVAIEIKPMQLDSTLFELPAGAKTSKSPY